MSGMDSLLSLNGWHGLNNGADILWSKSFSGSVGIGSIGAYTKGLGGYSFSVERSTWASGSGA
jgi:hypothetical protein